VEDAVLLSHQLAFMNMCAEIEAITIADIACPYKKTGKKVIYPFSA
jgi:hypothetical protein